MQIKLLRIMIAVLSVTTLHYPDKDVVVWIHDTNVSLVKYIPLVLRRAGGNGTASTAMAVPVFEGEKWRRLDSNLTCVIECPLRALRHSLGRLRGL